MDTFSSFACTAQGGKQAHSGGQVACQMIKTQDIFEKEVEHETLENEEGVIVTNSFDERIRSYFRDSTMEPNWMKDQGPDENCAIMCASEQIFQNNHASVPVALGA